MLLYSAHEEKNAPHTQGVALMLSKVARNALAGWESYGSRIIKASFNTKKGTIMHVIQCYAPTDDSNDDDKDQSAINHREVLKTGPHRSDGRSKRQSRHGQHRV
ncbi:unnamed protein product [Schistosoma margrebowiei]|uniref:Uncharacterized protein n=1 Tax=Schistosoma margrebowiei TaxID=48269 RepID=A0A183MGW2_9TREM|nr:unnamed protein product [Schistosoma margrebowiei]